MSVEKMDTDIKGLRDAILGVLKEEHVAQEVKNSSTI